MNTVSFSPSVVLHLPLFLLSFFLPVLLYWAKVRYPEMVPDEARFFIVVPLLLCLWKWMEVRSTQFTIDGEKLSIQKGILSQDIDEIRLFRIRDYKVKMPAKTRPFGVGDITIYSSDETDPEYTIRGVKSPRDIASFLAKQVDASRKKLKVQPLEVVEGGLS